MGVLVYIIAQVNDLFFLILSSIVNYLTVTVHSFFNLGVL